MAGIVPSGQTDLNPALNSVQTMVAMNVGGDGVAQKWLIAVYHNTPAQSHGRPDLAEALTVELRVALKG